MIDIQASVREYQVMVAKKHLPISIQLSSMMVVDNVISGMVCASLCFNKLDSDHSEGINSFQYNPSGLNDCHCTKASIDCFEQDEFSLTNALELDDIDDGSFLLSSLLSACGN